MLMNVLKNYSTVQLAFWHSRTKNWNITWRMIVWRDLWNANIVRSTFNSICWVCDGSLPFWCDYCVILCIVVHFWYPCCFTTFTSLMGLFVFFYHSWHCCYSFIGCCILFLCYSIVDNHYRDDCQEFPVHCQYDCGVALPRRSMHNHEQNMCENTPVSCPYKCVNCSNTVLRKNLQQHMADYSQQHVEMTCNFAGMMRESYVVIPCHALMCSLLSFWLSLRFFCLVLFFAAHRYFVVCNLYLVSFCSCLIW
jgi:hypothetical protein